MIGCDCSIVVGTTQALMRAAGHDGVHVLYVDGDRDDGTPDPEKSQSAAYLALWLAMHGQPFRAGPAVPAAYFPHEDSLTSTEGRELLEILLRDPRIRIIEISEYASPRDFDRRCVAEIIELVAHGLARP